MVRPPDATPDGTGPGEPDRETGAAPSDPPLRLPLLPPPSMEAVVATATSAPIRERFRRLVELCGPNGIALDDEGHLHPDDAERAVTALATGDVLHPPAPGEPTRPVVDPAELTGLQATLRWATRVGCVDVAGGRLVGRPGWEAAAQADALTGFDQVIDALFALGPVSIWRWEAATFPDPELQEYLDQGAPMLLGGLYAAAAPLPAEDVYDVVTASVDDAFPPPPGWGAADRENWDVILRCEVDAMIDALELAGVVIREDADEVVDETGRRHRWNGILSITPAGTRATQRICSAAGLDVISLESVAQTDVLGVLDLFDDISPDVLGDALEAWAAARDRSAAATELAAIALAADRAADPVTVVRSFGVLEHVGVDAEPVVRSLLDSPLRALASMWLVGKGLESEHVVPQELVAAEFVRVLGAMLLAGGPRAVADEFSSLGAEDEQRAMLDLMWRADRPETAVVLDALGQHLPDRALAKTARRCAVRHRSFIANAETGSADTA